LAKSKGKLVLSVVLTFLLFGSLIVLVSNPVSASPDQNEVPPTPDGGNFTITLDLHTPVSITVTGYAGVGGAATIPSTIGGYPVLTIEADSFSGNTNLTSITIPSSITTIRSAAFTDCPSLTSINVDLANSNYASIDGVLYDKSFATLIKYPGGKTGIFTVPSSVTNIVEWAFSGQAKLESVTIPGCVTRIGDNSFSYCTALSSVTIAKGLQQIGDMAFMGCTNLTSIVLPDSVDTTEYQVFDGCINLANVTISKNLTTITPYMFKNCHSMRSVVIPGSVKSIEQGVFVGCNNLTILFEGDAPSVVRTESDNYFPNFVVNSYVGSSGFTSPLWNGIRSVQLDGPLAKPVEIIITSDSSASSLGIVSTLSGKMQLLNNSQGVAGLNLTIAYSANDGTSWITLPSVVTASDGTFTRSWLPPATGYICSI
jgi:hypothetical protein